MRTLKLHQKDSGPLFMILRQFSISKQIPSVNSLLKNHKPGKAKRHRAGRINCNLSIDSTNGQKKSSNFERYSSFNPSPLSLQQLINFGK